ncbi:MAG TPA: orotidine-5'-phosphate decarboxylase [Anaerolineales bacterium]|nr:orotidine-5'-phosphate decarboxylase [Anaerolineales bacterium]
MNFFDSLTSRARQINSLLCIGLDPRVVSASEAREACFRLIDSTAPYAAAFKPNAAFFELLGPEGWAALKDVIAYVPPDIPVILDAKRGDIANTAEAYARSAFDELGAHAITASPYLGRDSLAPFLNRPDRGVFLLCKTSNPGAGEIQSLQTGEVSRSASPVLLYEYIAQRAGQWNENNNLGLVVGATDLEALARVRNLAPDLWFLVPGIGAQGGDLQKALQAGLRNDGLGMLINVSRAVATAPDPAEAARKLRDDINEPRKFTNYELRDMRYAIRNTQHASLAQDLVTSQCVRFGQFKLKSGQTSPVYLDLRRLVTHPAILRRVAQAYAKILRELEFDRLVGIPYAALPIATAISLEMDRPLIYPRRETKDYGTQASIEGDFNPGETVVVIDDLATTGETKIETIQRLETARLKVHDVVVLIDREQGAGEYLKQRGYNYHAVAGLRSLLNEWKESGAINDEQFAEVKPFLRP